MSVKREALGNDLDNQHLNRIQIYQPVFIINPSIVLPDQLQSNPIIKLRYPIRGAITLGASLDRFDFDVMLVVDEA